MALIYVTGISSSGKSSVLKYLVEKGFEAHGIDEEGFADWINRETNQIEQFPQNGDEEAFHDWYEKHTWVLSHERISEIKKRSELENKIILIIGYADDNDEVNLLFDKTIYLAVDEQTIRSRIASRQDNHFGKTPGEMTAILKWMRENDQRYRDTSDLVIDANFPLKNVVEQVVEGLSSHE